MLADPGPHRRLGSLTGVPPPDTGRGTTLLLVRHGRTAWTDDGRICGGDDAGPPLTADGRAEARQAAALVGRFTAEAPGGPPVLLASPTLRARQTAEEIAAHLGAAGACVAEHPDWRELDQGAWHGLDRRRIAAGWPVEHAAWHRSELAAPPGGERVAALRARVERALAAAVVVHPDRTVVVVTHAGPVRAAVAAALDAGPAALWRLRVDPGSVTVLRRWSDGGTEVSAVNLRGGA